MSRSARQLDQDIARWQGSRVQALLFARPQWTLARSQAWAKRHGFVPLKTHVTARYVRLRLHTPVTGADKRTITFGVGIKGIVEERL